MTRGATTTTKGLSWARSARAGLYFCVGRVHRHMRRGRYARRIGATAPVYLAAVLEYMAAEVLDIAGNLARLHGRKRITPRLVRLAAQDDAELQRVFQAVDIAGGGAGGGQQK
jgi:histone H2A